MAQDPKKLYSFLRANNLTQKSEVDFINEYSSDRAKQTQLYNFFRENNLTQKDESGFIGEYFPNADGVSPQGSVGTSTTSVEPTMNGQQSTQGLQGQSAPSSEPSLPESTVQVPPIADPTNISPQIAQANQIASEYGQEGEEYQVEIPEGYRLIQGEVDESGRLLNPYLVNEATGERSNIVPTVDTPVMTKAEALAQNERIAQEEAMEDKGILSDTYNSAVIGATRLNDMFASIPEYLYRIGAIPQNLLADAIENNAGEGSADWLRARYENVNNGVYNPLRILSDYTKGQREISEDYAQRVTQFENDISGSIREGNLGDAGRQVLNAIVQSTPAMIGMVATSGAGAAANLGTVGRTALNALPFAAGAYQDIENEDMPENLKLLASGLKGLSEVVFEQEFGTLPIIEGIINKSIGRDAVKEFTEGYMQRLMNTNNIPASAFRGSISEGATELSNNIIAKYSGENPDQDLWEGVVDAMIVGGVMDAGLSGLSNVSDRIHDRSLRQEAKDIEAQISDIQSDMQNMTDQEAQILQSSLNGRVERLNAIIDQDAVDTPPLTVYEQQQLDNISRRESELNRMVESEGISDGTRSALESEIEGLEESRNDVMEEASANRTGVSVSEALIPENQSVFLMNGERGDIRLDGQTVVFETSDTIRELGNVDQLTDSDLALFGIEVESPLDISVADNNSVSITGATFINPNENPMDAINYDSNGEITSVTLQNENGRPRTIRGQRAQEIAYQYTLKNFEQNATETEIESAIQEAESLLGTEQTVEQNQPAETATDIIQEPQTEGVINETQQSNLESSEVSLEGRQVAPLGETVGSTQEVVNEVTTPIVETSPATGPQDQNVDVTPEQITQPDVQSQETIQENEQAPVRAEEIQEVTTDNQVRPRATKGMLQGISSKLSRSGLAKSVKIASSQDIATDLSSRGINVSAENVNGYVDAEGNIVINQDRATLDSPIHEVSHVWEQTVERDNPQLHARGIELIQTPEGNPYVEYVRGTQPGLEGASLYKEALAQAIGDRGARLIESRQQPRLREWLKDAWEYIGSLVGISGRTAEQIANMSLNEYADAVAVDLLSGKPYNTAPNGDIVMETSATSEAILSPSEKKIADFMQRMRDKHNIQYQGQIDNNRLSPEDLVEFMDVAEEMAKIGQVSTLKDLQDIARSIGIRSDRDIRTAWAIAKEHIQGTPETTAFKKSQITEAIGQRVDGLSIEEKREIGKRIVDEGILDPDQFVADIIENPIALQTHEVFALAYGYSNLQNRIDDVSRELRNNPMSSDLLIQQDALLALQSDYQNAIALTATEQGQALAVRDIESDADFNAVSALREMKKVGEVDAETAARVEELGRELNETKSELRQRVRELDDLRAAQDQSGINSESQSVKPKRTGGSVRARRDAVEVLDSLDLSSFGLAGLNFQANDVLRFSISPNTALTQSLSDAVATMKGDVNGGMPIADALEKAVDSVNTAIGKGKWNELAFRSKFVNAYTDKGHVSPVRKPYIATDGKPVVPGTYLSDIVAQYRSENGEDMTIDQMVEATKSELGDSFSERDVRDAISGYGRATNKTRTDDQKNVATAKTIGRLTSRLEDLENLGYSPTSKQGRARNVNEEIKDLRVRINELIDSLVDSPEYKAQMKQALEQKKRYIENYIKEVEGRVQFYREANRRGERVPDGYFSKKPKYDFTSDPDIIALEKRREETKNKLKEEVYKHGLKNRTMPQRAFDAVNDIIFNTTRMLSAGADLSSYLVQGGFVTMSNPVLATRSLIESVSKAGSTEAYNDYFNNLQRQPLYEYARSAKLNMQLPSFYQTIQEEQLGTSNPITKGVEVLIDKVFGKNKEQAQKWKDRFPFTAAERQYAIFLSDIRFKLFEQTVNDAMNHFGLDIKSDNGKEKMRDIATAINDITMASNVRSLQGSTRLQKLGNMVFFSLRKLAAGWKLMTKLPYYAGSYALNKGAALGGSMGITNAASIKNATDFQAFMFQKLYGRYAGASLGMGALITIIPSLIANALYDPEDEEEPLPFYNPNVLNATSSDFMKLRYGNTRMDFTLGIAGNTVLLSRLVSGGYMTSSDPVFREFGGRTAGMSNKTEQDIIIDYFKNKLAPTPSIGYNYFLGGEYGKAEATDRIAESFYPMWISGITEQYESTNSIANAAAFGALGIMGISANTYGGVEFADHRGTDNAEARRVFEKLLISDTSPTMKTKNMYSESGVVKLQSSDFKEQYKKDYDEYMTASTLANKDIISNSKLSPEKVESLVGNMKARANKYAEVKSTGIYLDETFRKVRNSRGEVFKLKNDQLAEKAKIIKQYMSGRGRGSLPTLRRDARDKLREEGKKISPEILDMEAYLNLYTEANREASERMTRLIDGGRVTPIPEFEYDPKIDELGEYDD